MRRALSLLIMIITTIPASTANARGKEVQLVGRLARQTMRVCGQHGQWMQVDPHYRVGFVRLLVDHKRHQLKALLNTIVRIYGVPQRPVPTPRSQPRGHNCPLEQRRSDWVPLGTGFAVRRMPVGTLMMVGGIRVRKIAPYRGASIVRTKNADSVVARFTNRFAVTLRDLTLVAHYEGCYGKPGAFDRPLRVALLLPGKSVHFTADTRAVRRGRNYRLSYFRVVHSDGPHNLDLDLSPWRFGIDVSCRGRK